MPWGVIIMVVSILAGIGLSAFFGGRMRTKVLKKNIAEDLTDRKDGWIKQTLDRLKTKKDDDVLDDFLVNYGGKKDEENDDFNNS